MFALQNYNETRPFQPESQSRSHDGRSPNNQDAALNISSDFPPENSSQHSTASLFDDYSAFDEPQFASYGEVDRFLVPRTSEGGCLSGVSSTASLGSA